MLEYQEALDRLLAGTKPLPAERVALDDAIGRILAEPLAAGLTQPPFPASAMDGYAIRWTDMPGPWTVIGESAAGSASSGSVNTREAVRIFTGAPVPSGADTVVVQEDAVRGGDILTLTGDGPPRKGAHIRPEGNDFSEGMPLLPAGSRVTAAVIGLAAAAGHARLTVHRRPRIAVIAAGNELVPPGTRPGPAQIVAGNGPMITAQLQQDGADVTDFGIVPDDLGAITDAIRRAGDFDMLLTIGGASVGDHDLVRAALKAAGATLEFWRIAIKPGKPLIAGRMGQTRIIGLPGNPVSAYVCTLLFARPVLQRMQGVDVCETAETAILGSPLPGNGDRRDHLRAHLEADRITPLATQDSAQLAVLARANALIVRPPFVKASKTGDSVPFIRLDRT
ncbi:molybdopterin molybdotransferase MoeA [Pacificimonas sp. WHA3]|uniref:Molybdopterin molybdenumtransferase n=2 Tax=Pacificimonas pallii TaxID=2827236 RepID=A0ABS6SDM4_9SPHN|nr:gephyrin-like molybdotransferase Glp [Pacificimonas pallii]MBV7256522.1 molybdopterin molybdotransferase MoeA [Pacificimonas pallii]